MQCSEAQSKSRALSVQEPPQYIYPLRIRAKANPADRRADYGDDKSRHWRTRMQAPSRRRSRDWHALSLEVSTVDRIDRERTGIN